MVNENLVASKLVELADRLERARSRCPATAAQLAADRDALDLVAFNLMLAVQTCADIAAHVITDEGWPAAKTLAAAFDRLVEHGVTRPELAEQLKRAVGLRNVVAHGCTRINVVMVHAAASSGIADLEGFASDIAHFVASRLANVP